MAKAQAIGSATMRYKAAKVRKGERTKPKNKKRKPRVGQGRP